MSTVDSRFSTPRGSARRSTQVSEDERFTSTRSLASTRSFSSNDGEYTTPLRDAKVSYSSDEYEPPALTAHQSYYKNIAFAKPSIPPPAPPPSASAAVAAPPVMMSAPYTDTVRATARHSVNSPSGAIYGNHIIQNTQSTTSPLRHTVPEPRQAMHSKVTVVNSYDTVDVFSLARHNRVEEVKKILDNGLPINTRDIHGNTLLIIACQNGLKRLAKLVLRYGANINCKNYRGNTPLHFSFAYGYGDSLGAYLISKGADATIRNQDGLVCFHGIEERSQST